MNNVIYTISSSWESFSIGILIGIIFTITVEIIIFAKGYDHTGEWGEQKQDGE